MISEVRTFQWNVTEAQQISQTFSWQVGEGPLYWYRIVWKDPQEVGCSCPGEGPICMKAEIWTVMATGMEHLCERLTQETCNIDASGKKFKTVEKWGRPALCCDVASGHYAVIDAYIPVNFCGICSCLKYIDPCDCPSMTCSTISTMSMAMAPAIENLYGFHSLPYQAEDAFKTEDVGIVQAKESIIETQCDCPLPSNLMFKNNLNKLDFLGQFLKRNKFELPSEFELSYNLMNNAWQKNFHYENQEEKFDVLVEWACADDAVDPDQEGWSFHLHVKNTKNNNVKHSRILVNFATYGVLNKQGLFEVLFNYNTNNNAVIVNQPMTVKSKILHDDIGIFNGSWKNDPLMKVNLQIKRKA